MSYLFLRSKRSAPPPRQPSPSWGAPSRSSGSSGGPAGPGALRPGMSESSRRARNAAERRLDSALGDRPAAMGRRRIDPSEHRRAYAEGVVAPGKPCVELRRAAPAPAALVELALERRARDRRDET